jgi:hypothetical protein
MLLLHIGRGEDLEVGEATLRIVVGLPKPESLMDFN